MAGGSSVLHFIGAANNMLLSWANGAGQLRVNDLGGEVDNYEFTDGTVMQADDFAFV